MPELPDVVIRVQNSGWDERVHVYRSGSTVDSFAVITDRLLVVVDTMVSRAAMTVVMEDLLYATPAHPLLVVNTHGDWDHVWGNGLFVGANARYPAPIIGHHLSVERMRSARSVELLQHFRQEHPGRYDTASWEPPTLTFSGDSKIEGGDLTLEILETPGHTSDHLSVWIPQLRLLLAGDAAEAPIPWVSTAQALPDLRASLRRLAALNADTVLYCHARSMTTPSIIHRNIAYFNELERRCRAAAATTSEPSTEISWSLEEAVGDLFPPSEHISFYRDAHLAATRVMAEWVRGPMPA